MSKVTMQELEALDQELSLLGEENDRLALMKTHLTEIKTRLEPDLVNETMLASEIKFNDAVVEITQPTQVIVLFQSRPEYEVVPGVDMSTYPNNILQGVSELIQKHSPLLDKLSKLEVRKLLHDILGVGGPLGDMLDEKIRELEDSNPHLKY